MPSCLLFFVSTAQDDIMALAGFGGPTSKGGDSMGNSLSKETSTRKIRSSDVSTGAPTIERRRIPWEVIRREVLKARKGAADALAHLAFVNTALKASGGRDQRLSDMLGQARDLYAGLAAWRRD